MKTNHAILALASLLVLCGCESRSSHPSDQTLLANFRKHEQVFEKLVGMIREDKGLSRLDGEVIDLGVSKERHQEYRSLFSKVGIPRGFYAFHDPEDFTFIASAQGLSVSGSSKGYAYLEEKPDLVVTNLEGYWSADGKSFTAYQHIKDNWYLYFDFED